MEQARFVIRDEDDEENKVTLDGSPPTPECTGPSSAEQQPARGGGAEQEPNIDEGAARGEFAEQEPNIDECVALGEGAEQEPNIDEGVALGEGAEQELNVDEGAESTAAKQQPLNGEGAGSTCAEQQPLIDEGQATCSKQLTQKIVRPSRMLEWEQINTQQVEGEEEGEEDGEEDGKEEREDEREDEQEEEQEEQDPPYQPSEWSIFTLSNFKSMVSSLAGISEKTEPLSDTSQSEQETSLVASGDSQADSEETQEKTKEIVEDVGAKEEKASRILRLLLTFCMILSGIILVCVIIYMLVNSLPRIFDHFFATD